MSKQNKIADARKHKGLYPQLEDVVNVKKLRQHIARGTVKMVGHPSKDLALYMYTPLCKQKKYWDLVTLTTRGLVRTSKGTVVGRPLFTFFGEDGRSSANPVPAVDATWTGSEKVDGTMITAFCYKDEMEFSTKGTFENWQLERVRELWPSDVIVPAGQTWILEYVGPENTVVVPYAQEQLYILAVVDNWTGKDLPISDVPAYFARPAPAPAFDCVDDLLKLDPGDGSREGFVITRKNKKGPDFRIKVKFPSYLARKLEIVSGATPKDSGPSPA